MEHLWSGSFVSTRHAFLWFSVVKGVICVNLPTNVKETKSADAILAYTGSYRENQRSSLKISYHETGQGIGQQDGVGYLKGIMLHTNQVIEFDVETMTDYHIAGTYISRHPSDEGVFRLRRSHQKS